MLCIDSLAAGNGLAACDGLATGYSGGAINRLVSGNMLRIYRLATGNGLTTRNGLLFIDGLIAFDMAVAIDFLISFYRRGAVCYGIAGHVLVSIDRVISIGRSIAIYDLITVYNLAFVDCLGTINGLVAFDVAVLIYRLAAVDCRIPFDGGSTVYGLIPSHVLRIDSLATGDGLAASNGGRTIRCGITCDMLIAVYGLISLNGGIVKSYISIDR